MCQTLDVLFQTIFEAGPPGTCERLHNLEAGDLKSNVERLERP